MTTEEFKNLKVGDSVYVIEDFNDPYKYPKLAYIQVMKKLHDRIWSHSDYSLDITFLTEIEGWKWIRDYYKVEIRLLEERLTFVESKIK